ncbi:CSC1-like protein At3g54510 isoform X2 [Vigna radiata var. radiata]|uniref:CSC1-like protein At3g54510 isoform X2 n=1 Tax=Vigna radiata var. radiata TaxID=3916 RepID=A0A1S3U0B8_VIGRR|nr:CSC1-like protein At3g54510 isoform X2 [Vigna radiata var. radiata]
MNPQSLLASAAINIGLALLILSLFSVLKKQPSNASVYYARPLSHRRQIPVHFPSSPLRRFLPSLSWVFRAFSVTEAQILDAHGLDSLVIIRLFKFGIKFFAVCSLVGLMVLLPVNYGAQEVQNGSYFTMDSFTISNVKIGSNRLWVHFACLCFISFYGMFLLYKEYNEILIRRIQQIQKLKNRPDQFTVLVREIPLCIEHKARDCCVDHFFRRHYPNTYRSYQMLYKTEELEESVSHAKSLSRKIEDMRKSCIANKSKNRSSLLGLLHGETSKADSDLLEEKLQALSHKIHQLQCRDMLQRKELPVAFVIFKSRSGAAAAAHLQQHSHPLLWITELAPEPRDVSWRNMRVSYRVVPLYRLGVVIAASLLTVFFAIPVTAVQGIAKYEKLKKWFPPATAVQLIPGLSSIVTGFLPSVVLKAFIYIVPFTMFAMAKIAGCIARSKEEMKACNMVFYFLVGNVFFWSVLSGSLLDLIGEFITQPKAIPTHLAGAVSAQADFFVTYILTDGLSGFSLEVLQPGMLIWDILKSCVYGSQRETSPYLYSFPYFRIIPLVSLSILIGTVYAVVAPLLLPFLIVYFCLGYVVFVNQIQDVYETTYQTCGQYWPYIHHYILLAIILMQITMIGLFGLKLKPAASISTIPLIMFTLMFNEYCKMRFLPSFHHYSLLDAAENDELDEKCGLLELHCENAMNAYCPPGLRPVNFMASESSSTPLVSSS